MSALTYHPEPELIMRMTRKGARGDKRHRLYTDEAGWQHNGAMM